MTRGAVLRVAGATRRSLFGSERRRQQCLRLFARLEREAHLCSNERDCHGSEQPAPNRLRSSLCTHVGLLIEQLLCHNRARWSIRNTACPQYSHRWGPALRTSQYENQGPAGVPIPWCGALSRLFFLASHRIDYAGSIMLRTRHIRDILCRAGSGSPYMYGGRYQ